MGYPGQLNVCCNIQVITAAPYPEARADQNVSKLLVCILLIAQANGSL